MENNQIKLVEWPNYLVSEEGNVFNKRGHKMAQHIQNGYARITLIVKGKEKTVFAHRVVAEAFLSNPENKPFVNHINCIRNDNRVANLEWCTRQENSDHSWKFGGQKTKKVKKHPHCVEVLCLRTGVAFDSIKEFCRSRHIRQSSVSKAVNVSLKTKFDVVALTGKELEINL